MRSYHTRSKHSLVFDSQKKSKNGTCRQSCKFIQNPPCFSKLWHFFIFSIMKDFEDDARFLYGRFPNQSAFFKKSANCISVVQISEQALRKRESGLYLAPVDWYNDLNSSHHTRALYSRAFNLRGWMSINNVKTFTEVWTMEKLSKESKNGKICPHHCEIPENFGPISCTISG